MDEEANSWLRRTKFSHTVYHRWDSLRLNSVPFIVEPSRNSGLKSRPTSASSTQKPNPDISKIQRSFISNKQRSLSPLPESNLSEVFKEAKSDSKRFSTPTPRLRERTKEFKNKLFNKDPQDSKSADSKSSSNTSPLKLLSSGKGVISQSSGKILPGPNTSIPVEEKSPRSKQPKTGLLISPSCLLG